jgi:hypothetical protein
LAVSACRIELLTGCFRPKAEVAELRKRTFNVELNGAPLAARPSDRRERF